DAAGDPVVAVGVAAAAIAGEVHAGVGGEVGVEEALVVAVDRAHLARPGVEDDEVALGLALEDVAGGVDDRRLHAEERERGRAGLGRPGAGQRRDQDAAVLGLPPGIDDRAAAAAHDVVVPAPGLGVDRLADAAEQ